MSRFTSILLVSSLDDGKTWVLMREFGYGFGGGPPGSYHGARGLETDFASVPKLFGAILPQWDKYANGEASVKLLSGECDWMSVSYIRVTKEEPGQMSRIRFGPRYRKAIVEWT